MISLFADLISGPSDSHQRRSQKSELYLGSDDSDDIYFTQDDSWEIEKVAEIVFDACEDGSGHTHTDDIIVYVKQNWIQKGDNLQEVSNHVFFNSHICVSTFVMQLHWFLLSDFNYDLFKKI